MKKHTRNLSKLCLSLAIVCCSTVIMANETKETEANKKTSSMLSMKTDENIERLVASKSGHVYLSLADKAIKEEKGEAAITFSLLAAQYGYPEKGYKKIAKVYEHGMGKVEQNDLLTACYYNLARPYPNVQLTNRCLLESSGNFKIAPNEGVQNKQEAMEKAATISHRFCNGISIGLFNPRIDKLTLQALEEKLCHPEQNKDHINDLSKGDLVMEKDKIYQVDENLQLEVYNSPLAIGQIIKVKQPEYQPYIYDGKQLVFAKEGAQIIKGTKIYYLHEGKLVPKNQNKEK